jgi:hypothetical protein
MRHSPFALLVHSCGQSRRTHGPARRLETPLISVLPAVSRRPWPAEKRPLARSMAHMLAGFRNIRRKEAQEA